MSAIAPSALAHRPMLRGGVPLVLGLVLALCGAAPGVSDDVFLRNGSVFEGVVSRDLGEVLVVELAGGEMHFPKSHILRVDKALTPAQQLASRRADLERSDAPPARWLELARWASENDLDREAAALFRRVAEEAPDATGLAAPMRRLGYVRDEEGGWITVAEQKRKQGFVAYQGSWVTPEERSELLTADRERAEARRLERAERERELEVERKLARLERLEREAADREAQRAEESGPTDNDVAIAQIDLLRDVLDRQAPPVVPQRTGGMVVPNVVALGAFVGSGARTRSSDDTWKIMSVRQPGSLIGIDQFRRPARQP